MAGWAGLHLRAPLLDVGQRLRPRRRRRCGAWPGRCGAFEAGERGTLGERGQLCAAEEPYGDAAGAGNEDRREQVARDTTREQAIDEKAAFTVRATMRTAAAAARVRAR